MTLPYEQDRESNPPSTFLLDALYCSEQHWELHPEEDDELEECYYSSGFGDPPPALLEQDLFWDDEELFSLSSKESPNPLHESLSADIALETARAEATDWILRAQAHHGFYVPTAVLAVNYLDRFLSSSCLDMDKPWMAQLAAVACLSLAAKVEETQVPLLLDLQVRSNFLEREKKERPFYLHFTEVL